MVRGRRDGKVLFREREVDMSEIVLIRERKVAIHRHIQVEKRYHE
jgi:hypothetical protein